MIQSMPTVINTKLPVHNFLLIGKNQSQANATATDRHPANNSFDRPSYVLPFSCTHLPAAYPNITFAIAGNVLSTPSGSNGTPSPWYKWSGPNSHISSFVPALVSMMSGSW